MLYHLHEKSLDPARAVQSQTLCVPVPMPSKTTSPLEIEEITSPSTVQMSKDLVSKGASLTRD